MKTRSIEMSMLFNTYRALLTEKQQNVMELYCDCDCSLAEIAEQTGVSRQGVRASIVGAEKSLSAYESVLHVLSGRRARSVEFSALKSCLQSGEVEQAKQIVEKLIDSEE